MSKSSDLLRDLMLADSDGNRASVVNVRSAESGCDHLEITTQSAYEKENGIKTIHKVSRRKQLMTNPTQPIEHFTLEQVEQKAKHFKFADSATLYAFNITQLHALLNSAINERIGEPVGLTSFMPSAEGFTFVAFKSSDVPPETKVYTLKDIKP